MMKYIYLILFTFISIKGLSQNNPSGIPTQLSTGWFRHGWDQSDSGKIFTNRNPNFTPRFPGTVEFYQNVGVDSLLSLWTGGRWVKLIPGFDSTSMSNRINLKLNIADTGAMLSPYLRKIDTTNKWVQDVYVRNDSLFKFKNGTETFLDTLGNGGSGSGLTSVGLSMPSAFTVTNSPLTSNGALNVIMPGLSTQYVRANGTIATTDTSMIPNFYLKVRSLLSGTSPITYNSSTGAIGIPNANNTGQKGAATFSNSDFIDNGAGLISIRNPAGAPGVDTIFRTPGIDSIYFTINSTQYSILDSVGTSGGGGGTVTQVNSGFGLNGGPITTTGTLQVDTSSIATNRYVDSRQQSFLGIIYNNNTWANLSPFTQTGGITAAAVGGKINISAGAGTFTQTLDLNWYSMLERWKMTARFKVTSAPSGTTYGIGIGMHSTNTYGAVNALGRIDLTNGGSGGKVILNGHTDNQQMAISSTALSFSVNDTIELRVERNVDSIRVTAINRSQASASVTAAFQYNLITGIPQLPNTGRFSIYSFGGTQSIDSISVTSEEIKNAVALTIGDSKTQGYYAQSFNNRFTSLFNNKVPTTVLHAGGYDRTTEWLSYLPEIKALNPRQVLLTNPSNDLRSGISAGTSEAQYGEIVDSLIAWGIDVFHGLAFYETAQDNSAWNTFIVANYNPERIIDFWGPTKNCVGCIDGDGVHLTELGNDTAYDTQLWAYKMIGGSNIISSGQSFTGTDNTLAMFSGNTLVDSKVYQDADRVYMSSGFESHSTDPGFDLYKTNAATDEKGWIWYSDAANIYLAAFNDGRNSVSNAIKINRTGTNINYTTIANGNLIVGATSDPGSYPLSVITAGPGLSRFRTSNAAGGYIGFENGTTPTGYIGYGSVLTTGAANTSFTIRSQDDTIHFSNNLGTSMAKFANGKIYVTSHAIGSNSDSALIWDRTTNEYKYAKINSSGIATLNTLTASTQTFATGTSGSDFNISSSSSTHTFNIPDAGSSVRGVVSLGSQNFHGQKTFDNGLIATSTASTRVQISGNISSGAAPGIAGIGVGVQSMSYTNTAAAGTETNGQNFNLFAAPVLTSSNAISYTGDVANVRFTGAPIASGSTTLSHPYDIYALDVNLLQTLALGLNEQNTSATLGNGSNIVYAGSGGDTFTLPSLATHPGKTYLIKNAGSGNLTLARSGSDNLYDTSSVTSITISAGVARIVVAGSSFWYIE